MQVSFNFIIYQFSNWTNILTFLQKLIDSSSQSDFEIRNIGVHIIEVHHLLCDFGQLVPFSCLKLRCYYLIYRIMMMKTGDKCSRVHEMHVLNMGCLHNFWTNSQCLIFVCLFFHLLCSTRLISFIFPTNSKTH